MAAAILTIVISVVVGGGTWLLAGSRLTLAEEAERNEILNLVTYFAIALPVVFVVVFFLIEKL